MRALRFEKDVPHPATGKYGRDASGEFNGMLYGTVGELIDKQLLPMTHAQALIGAKGVARELNRVGITSIQDMSRLEEISRRQLYHANIERSFTDTRIFSDLRDRGELTVRVYSMLPLRQWPGLAAAGIRPRSGDGWLSFGGLKDLADNGYMLEPYADTPKYRGGWTFRMVDEAFEERQIVESDRAGWDMGMHVIGDLALRPRSTGTTAITVHAIVASACTPGTRIPTTSRAGRGVAAGLARRALRDRARARS
jgi:predicted amidohydrolase YtcJ